MSVNLDKGGPEKKKFNLSKSDSPSAVQSKSSQEESPKSNRAWIWVLLLLLGIGFGAWAIMSGKSNGDDNSEVAEATAAPSPTEGSNGTSDPGNPSSSDGRGTATEPIATTEANSVDPSSSQATNSGNSVSANQPTQASDRNASSPSQSNDGNSAQSIQKSRFVKFLAGSARLGRVDNSIIVDVVSKLKNDNKLRVKVVGYSSSEGNASTNQNLSQQRAKSFKQFLVRHGVSSSQIEIEGRGVDNPIASNDTEQGRSENRRVEITVLN